MSLTSSRRRVAVALTAALLAGAGTAWATRPDTTATATRQPASPAQAARTAPGDPGRTLLPAGSPGAPTTAGADRSPSSPGSPAAVPAPAGAGRTAGTPAKPSSVSISRIGVRMTILPTGVAPDGQMALPPDPANVGWYRYGSRPGDAAGATVLAAHIDSAQYGIGPLARLGELRAGDVITVQSGVRSQRYVVSSTRQLKKSSLDLASIFARTGPPRLHLITCGGDYDRQERHYAENVVVLALPTP